MKNLESIERVRHKYPGHFTEAPPPFLQISKSVFSPHGSKEERRESKFAAAGESIPPGRVDGPKEKRIRLRFSSSVTKNDALALLFLAGICAAARGVCGNRDRKERREEEEGFGFRALVDRGGR